MPSLISVANTFIDDIQVIMVNECIRNSSDFEVTYFQRLYAKDSPLWFVTIAKSRSLYYYFYNGGLIKGFPTSILIDCNGQVVFARSSQMNVTSFSSAIDTYIITRYNKLHPSAETSKITFERYEVLLPSRKYEIY